MERSESAELDPESAIDDTENASASDDEPVDDPHYAEVMESWDVWNGPCMCGSKRPGRGCTSARCINDDADEAPQKSSSESCSLRPIGSSEDSPPVTDDGRLAD